MPFFSIAQPFFPFSLIKLFQHSISTRCYCVLFKASRRPFFQRLYLAALFLQKIAHPQFSCSILAKNHSSPKIVHRRSNLSNATIIATVTIATNNRDTTLILPTSCVYLIIYLYVPPPILSLFSHTNFHSIVLS